MYLVICLNVFFKTVSKNCMTPSRGVIRDHRAEEKICRPLGFVDDATGLRWNSWRSPWLSDTALEEISQPNLPTNWIMEEIAFQHLPEFL